MASGDLTVVVVVVVVVIIPAANPVVPKSYHS